METPQKIFVAIGTVAVVGMAVIGGKVLFNDSGVAKRDAANANSSSTTSTNGTASAPQSTGATQNTTTAASAATYKDGTYVATQRYVVPRGDINAIAVTLTIADGKISAVKASDTYTDRESGMYVKSFESEVSTSASGQPLSSYSPSRIGGASLTTDAFTQAIDAVRSQAAA